LGLPKIFIFILTIEQLTALQFSYGTVLLI